MKIIQYQVMNVRGGGVADQLMLNHPPVHHTGVNRKIKRLILLRKSRNL
jgi:hypothetical protein